MKTQELTNLINQTIDTKNDSMTNLSVPQHFHNSWDSPQLDPAVALLGFPVLQVADATVAPTDVPSNGIFRFQVDTTPRYRFWVYLVYNTVATVPTGVWRMTPLTATSGDATKFLNGTGVYSSPVTYKNGVFSRAGNTASGSQTIAHGLGAIPNKVRMSAMAKWTGDSTAESIGVYNGTTTSTVYIARDAAAGNPISGTSSTYIIYMYDSATGATLQTASIAVDATNITLTWTLTGAGNASNMNVMWEVE